MFGSLTRLVAWLASWSGEGFILWGPNSYLYWNINGLGILGIKDFLGLGFRDVGL